MEVARELRLHYGITDALVEGLHTAANDIYKVSCSSGTYALKLYNSQSRNPEHVEWEVDLTQHLASSGAPVAQPVRGLNAFVERFDLNGQDGAAVLYVWAPGEKPQATTESFRALGTAAAQIHSAADTFQSRHSRPPYDSAGLIDEQLNRMEGLLTQAGRWQPARDMAERLKNTLVNPNLDQGICHMDLTLDNVHMQDSKLMVFDLDSAGWSWRALEPQKVLRSSRIDFNAWMDGYRSVREFGPEDEAAVAAFTIIGDLRVVAWDLGVAASSRGEPLLDAAGLTSVVDRWLQWESANVSDGL